MKEITADYIIEGWLTKYHGLTVKQLLEKHPEECKTPKWFKLYSVTQEQHDEWYAWAINEIVKSHKMSKKNAIRAFAFDYLNVAPDVV